MIEDEMEEFAMRRGRPGWDDRGAAPIEEMDEGMSADGEFVFQGRHERGHERRWRPEAGHAAEGPARHRLHQGAGFGGHGRHRAGHERRGQSGGAREELMERFGHRRGHGRDERRMGRRMFDHGELRLLVLALIAKEPRHGYELIKEIEARMGGSYSPSPGVIYPMLAWLEDMGYALVDAAEGGRKRYALTEQGRAFVEQNRSLIEQVFSQVERGGERGRGAPDPVVRAMENLKLALRLRLRRGALGEAEAEAVAAALDAAAQAIERS